MALKNQNECRCSNTSNNVSPQNRLSDSWESAECRLADADPLFALSQATPRSMKTVAF